MNARTRNVLLALAAGAFLFALGSELPLARWLGLEAPLAVTPELVARGERVVGGRCMHCHRDIALQPRVRGWDVARAYDALGRLPELSPAMPAFHGTEEDRRAVAAYLVALGEGR